MTFAKELGTQMVYSIVYVLGIPAAIIFASRWDGIVYNLTHLF